MYTIFGFGVDSVVEILAGYKTCLGNMLKPIISKKNTDMWDYI